MKGKSICQNGYDLDDLNLRIFRIVADHPGISPRGVFLEMQGRVSESCIRSRIYMLKVLGYVDSNNIGNCTALTLLKSGHAAIQEDSNVT